MPPIHEQQGGFWSRLHEPDKPVMLKDIADNLKNYGIAAAIYAFGVKVALEATGLVGLLGYVLGGLAALFFAATVCQSWALAQKQAQESLPFTNQDRIRHGPKPAFKLWLYIAIPFCLGSLTLTLAVWYARQA